MKEISMLHPMQPSKETDNKLRWEAWDQDFKLYIPKWRVPQPWPIRIVVRLDDDPRSFGSVPAPRGPESAQARNLNEPLTALLLKVKEHTQTVHYKPVGQPKMWEIGEPYIPFAFLDEQSPPDRIRIEVSWDPSAGTWDEEQ